MVRQYRERKEAKNTMDAIEQYQQLRLRIAALQRDIASQQQRHETLMALFCRDILPLEHQYTQALHDKIVHLLTFVAKKSLGKGEREALLVWNND